MFAKESQNLNIISVCIATFKRELLLEQLLLSLSKQQLPAGIKLEIVITDNNSDASAETVVQKFTNSENICYKYFIEPKKNISLARNKCVNNSTGNFICFIDDDETASDLWIKNLHDTLHIYDADGVFGYVEPIFDPKIPSPFRKREFYFSPVGETGSKALFYFTTNALVSSNIIKSEAIPFDPTYGLTGGEDAHLFERLERKGAKFIVCREAVTYENIPPDRGTTIYLYNRALRGGQAFARRKLENNKHITKRLSIICKAAIIFFFSLFLTLFHYPSISKKIKYLQLLGASIGKFRTVMGLFKRHPLN